jgi:hypothetical protein
MTAEIRDALRSFSRMPDRDLLSKRSILFQDGQKP